MPSPAAVLVLHAAATLYMTGVIWLVQLVHYPLLARLDALDALDRGAERALHRRHVRGTGVVVAPAMLAELSGALWLLVARPAALPFSEALLGAALVLALWLVTGLEQAPLHRRLARGRDPTAAARLVRTNWLRTALWSARAALVAVWLLRLT